MTSSPPPRARWAPTEQNLMLLERTFAHAPFPDARLRSSLAQELQVEARQVQVWFQNRRQKAKKAHSEPGSASPGATSPVTALPSPIPSPQHVAPQLPPSPPPPPLAPALAPPP